jgi:hypothetical protein
MSIEADNSALVTVEVWLTATALVNASGNVYAITWTERKPLKTDTKK